MTALVQYAVNLLSFMRPTSPQSSASKLYFRKYELTSSPLNSLISHGTFIGLEYPSLGSTGGGSIAAGSGEANGTGEANGNGLIGGGNGGIDANAGDGTPGALSGIDAGVGTAPEDEAVPLAPGACIDVPILSDIFVVQERGKRKK